MMFLFRNKFLKILFVINLFLLRDVILQAKSIEITPDLIFKQMEENTQKIYSLISKVELSIGLVKVGVSLLIQSPDKFAILSDNDNFKIVFDGEVLWMYLDALKEIYKLDTSGSGILSTYLKNFINPKYIVNSITRKTLFSLFEISIVKKEETKSLEALGDIDLTNTYGMCFKPILSEYIKNLLDIGCYYIYFSKQNFLPVYVLEIGYSNIMKGSLKVIEYKINEFIPNDKFKINFSSDVKVISFSEVIVQKLYFASQELYERAKSLFKNLPKKIFNWSN